MKTNFSPLSSVITLAAFLVGTISFGINATENKPFQPDHYLSYNIKTGPMRSHKVSLRDQFMDWTDFIVTDPIKLLNPTLKRHNNQVFPINNPQLHYTAFQLKETAPSNISAKVLVHNQFGNFTLDKFRPDRLLAPTHKKVLSLFGSDNEATPGDHYLCYEIPPVTVTTSFGFLKDQFRSREFETTLIAKRFCNPVAKIHEDKLFEIENDDITNHLMCFELDKKRILKLVELVNQFGRKKAVVTSDDEICVPSLKIHLPVECKGSLPNDEGLCNGQCPNPDDICRAETASGLCSCFPGHPLPCTDGIPDSQGICNGQCDDPNTICLADPASNKCNCIPTTPKFCSDGLPDPAGQCNGECPRGEACVVNTDQKCRCVPDLPPNCFDTLPDAGGQCNGDCPQGENCVVNADHRCGCRPEIPFCERLPTGQCAGSCDTTAEKCGIIPGTNECGCFMSITNPMSH